MGSAFAQEMDARGIMWFSASQGGIKMDFYSDPAINIEAVINCAAYIPKPSVAACDEHKAETIMGNVCVPQVIAGFCARNDIPLIHLSTGCLFDEQHAYSEEERPTRGFDGYCGFYVGTKLVAEDIVRRYPRHYILRLRLPFDEFDHPRNYLSKLAKFPIVYDHNNSLTHRGDFAKAALDLWQLKAPFGTYHVTNPGHVSARQLLVGMMMRGIIERCPEISESTVTTGTLLSTKKLADAGVKMRSVEEALIDAMDNWKPQNVLH